MPDTAPTDRSVKMREDFEDAYEENVKPDDPDWRRKNFYTSSLFGDDRVQACYELYKDAHQSGVEVGRAEGRAAIIEDLRAFEKECDENDQPIEAMGISSAIERIQGGK